MFVTVLAIAVIVLSPLKSAILIVIDLDTTMFHHYRAALLRSYTAVYFHSYKYNYIVAAIYVQLHM